MGQHWEQAFAAFAEPLMQKYQIPGIGIGIQQEGQLIYQKGYGYRHVARGLPVDEQTVFAIGSVTKAFTAMAVMQLQEAGKLSIEDYVQDYLSDFWLPSADGGSHVRIRHLLTHSSGLPPLPSLFFAMKQSLEADPYAQAMGLQLPEDVPAIDNVADLLSFMNGQDYEVLGEPGEVFSYSNEGFALLGAIVAQVSGQSYESYIKQHIFDPIGMTHSSFFLEDLQAYDDTTMLYVIEGSEDGSPYESPLWWDGPAMRPSGFIKSTVADMLKFSRVFCQDGLSGDKRILQKDSVADMMHPHIEAELGVYYGYGLMVTPDFFGHKLVEHGGDIKAATAQIGIFPDDDITGVALANLSNVPSKRMLFSAFNAMFGEDPAASHRQLPSKVVSEEQMQAAVGTYQSSEGMRLTINEEDGHLSLDVSGMACHIRAVGDDLFEVVMTDQFMILRLLRDDQQTVTGVYFGFRQFPKVA